jgi:large subunit ribosomal protein LP0
MAPKNLQKLAKKNAYLEKLQNLMDTMPKLLIVHADHVGSKQMSDIRIQLRGQAEVLMGKNTMIRYGLTAFQEQNPDVDVEKLISIVRGNIGFIFCRDNVDKVKQVIANNRLPAMAKAGVIATVDVSIPAGPTGLDPSQTSFCQALNIATKIVKGQIEIVNDVHLIKIGQRVNLSEQVLLQKLNIKPFSYGLKILHVYEEGNVFDASVLDITTASILAKFASGIRNCAALSREIGIPSSASAPYAVAQAFKNIASLCADISYSFKEIEDLKEFLKNPSKFSAGAAPASPTAAGKASPKGGKKVEAKVEEEEEEEAGFSLFD